MKDTKMFPIKLQIFDDGGEPEQENTDVVAEQKPETETKVEDAPTPKVDVDAIAKSIKESLEKDNEEKLKSISSEFEDKLKKIKEDANKDKENYNKIIEGLKGNNKVEDIIKEIEKNNQDADKAKKDKELLESLEMARLEAQNAKDEKLALEKKIANDKKLSDLALEKQKFENLLIKEKSDKPWLADKIDKVLADEDYDTQKNDYRTLSKFWDTEEEKEKYEAKKKAGGSAFDGVRVIDGKDKGNGIKDFTTNYLNRILGKK